MNWMGGTEGRYMETWMMKHDVLSLVFFVVLLLQICVGEDLYNVLRVPRGASRREIKRAYAKLAKQW